MQAKILRDGSLRHTGYARPRSTTPPGSESSNSPESNVLAWVVDDVCVASGFSSTKGGADRTGRLPCSRPCHLANVFFEIFSRRQNAAAESPLFSKRVRIRSHYSSDRRTLPFDWTRILLLLQ